MLLPAKLEWLRNSCNRKATFTESGGPSLSFTRKEHVARGNKRGKGYERDAVVIILGWEASKLLSLPPLRTLDSRGKWAF